jgi:hypothetical protein
VVVFLSRKFGKIRAHFLGEQSVMSIVFDKEKQLLDFKNAPPEMLSSTVLKLTDQKEILIRLRNTGIPINNEEIDIDDLIVWMDKYKELANYYKSNLENYIEKVLEHYLTYKYLHLKDNDVFIDVAAHMSPWAEILNNNLNIRAYKQDLRYAEGIDGVRIGGDACNLPLSPNSVDSMALHCSFECFQGDGDINLIKEAGRVLRVGGMIGIIPVYTATTHMVSTGPKCNLENILVEKEARWCWRDDRWGYSPFSRHYSPEIFKSRVFDNLCNMRGEILLFTNLQDIRNHFNQKVFCSMMFRATKIGFSVFRNIGQLLKRKKL